MKPMCKKCLLTPSALLLVDGEAREKGMKK